MATSTSKMNSQADQALKQLAYLAGALKAPRIIEAAARLADHARDAGWTHEEYLAAVLDREVATRNASGAELRIRAAGSEQNRTARMSRVTGYRLGTCPSGWSARGHATPITTPVGRVRPEVSELVATVASWLLTARRAAWCRPGSPCRVATGCPGSCPRGSDRLAFGPCSPSPPGGHVLSPRLERGFGR